MMKVSIVIPVYNEASGIGEFLLELVKELGKLRDSYQFELIVVDDGSTDGSYSVIKNTLINLLLPCRLIRLNRNFGHQAALLAGYHKANGEAIITLDADFQDPISLIPQFLSKWKEGAEVVFGRRKKRKDGPLKKATAALYYWVLHKFSEIKVKGNIGDFRLVSKEVLEQLLAAKERPTYLRGMVHYMGYQYQVIDYDRPKRKTGKSKYGFYKMVRLAMQGILNFSLVPLRLGVLLGLVVIPLGLFFLTYISVDTLVFEKVYPLYKWISVVNFIFMGFLFILIWIVSEYIGNIHDHLKSRPMYYIAEEKLLNVPREEPTSINI